MSATVSDPAAAARGGTGRRLPVPLRAAGAALAMGAAGMVPWTVLYALNTQAWPRVPWSAAVMGVYLWLYWRYAGGWGPPRATAATRAASARGRVPTTVVWRWSLLAGGSALLACTALWYLAARLAGGTTALFPDVSGSSFASVLASIAMASIVAGIVEEVAYRGYLQVPLEDRYGPVAAIGSVALLFALAHIGTDPAALPRVAVIFLLAVAYGTLAYLSGSLVPGIVLHTVGDFAGFAVAWWFSSRHGGTVGGAAGTQGWDAGLWLNLLQSLGFAALAAWAYGRLARAAGRGGSRTAVLDHHQQ